MELVKGLPNDLVLPCLLRVPYKFHRYLRAVSKSWNVLLSSPNFYYERRSNNLCEEGIACIHPYLQPLTRRVSFPPPWKVEVIIYYPLGNWWERLPPFPTEFDIMGPLHGQCHCVYVKLKQHLIVMGLHSGSDKRAAILMFDFLSRTWRLAIPQMSGSQIFDPRAVATSPEGLVFFVSGPSQRHLNAFLYNLDEDECSALPQIELDRSYLDGCVGAFHRDKYYVFPRGYESIQIYDPHRGQWDRVNNREFVDQCVSAFGSLYCFDYINGYYLTLKEFDVASNTFTMLSRYRKRRIFCTVPWHACIFITLASSTEAFGVDHYLFHVCHGNIWTSIEMPAQLPRSSFKTESAAAVLI